MTPNYFYRKKSWIILHSRTPDCGCTWTHTHTHLREQRPTFGQLLLPDCSAGLLMQAPPAPTPGHVSFVSQFLFSAPRRRVWKRLSPMTCWGLFLKRRLERPSRPETQGPLAPPDKCTWRHCWTVSCILW